MSVPEGSSLDFSTLRIIDTRAYVEQFGEFPYGLDDSRERPPLGSEATGPVYVEQIQGTAQLADLGEPPSEMPATVEEFLALAEYHERKLEQGRRYRMENVLHQAALWVAERDGIEYEQARLYVEERLDA